MRKTTKANGAIGKAIGYVRVSTQEQATEGVSLAAQEERARAYATLRGLDLVEVVREEGVSGGEPFASRPASARVLAAVEAGSVEAVVVCKLDRAFRDAVDCLSVTADWDARNVALHVIDMGGNAIDTHSAAGRFMLTVLAGAAEMEKNLIGERTSAALRHLASEGVKLGGEALGWERTEGVDADGRKLIREVVEESATIARMVELRKAGRTLRDIAAPLDAEGRATKRGGRWSAKVVFTTLRRAGVA